MEHSPDDPVCVIKVEVNCCSACQRKLRKILLKISGVLEVSYDPKTNLATIRGNFNPLKLIEAIKQQGKKAELISYSKNPVSHNRNSNHHHFDQNVHNKEEAASSGTKDYKGKAKVGHDDNKQCWNSSDDETCDDHDHIHECEDYVSPKNKDFVSTKNKKKYHKAEAYVAPQGVDPNICSDRYCKIHRRSGGMRDYVTQEERQKKYAMFMQMGAHPAGFFNGDMLPPYLYGHYGPDPDYGFYPPAQPMSGVNDFTRYFGDQDSRTCSIM